MKIDNALTSRPIAQPSQAKAPTLSKRGVQISNEVSANFETVQVPYCRWNANFGPVEAPPSLQITRTKYNRTMAVVLRDPHATASLNNATECVVRVLETMVPSDPIILEVPEVSGAGGFVGPNETVDSYEMEQYGLTTQVIGFTHTATARPAVSFYYQANPAGISRLLLDNWSQVDYWTVDAGSISASGAVASAVTKMVSAAAGATSTSLNKRNADGISPQAHYYTATIVENAWFAGQDFMDFQALLPTPTPVADATPMLSANSANTASVPAPSLVPHVTTVTSFLPNPTSVVQANVLFQLKGANPNVAAGFANYGAVVGFAALGAVALAGFTALSRKARAAAAQQLPVAAPDVTEGEQSV